MLGNAVHFNPKKSFNQLLHNVENNQITIRTAIDFGSNVIMLI